MDKEYLQHIAGSPYVEEGVFDRLSSRGEAFVQRMNEMGPPTSQSPQHLKVQDRFEELLNDLKTILKPFAEGQDSVHNRLVKMPTPMIDGDVKLARQLVVLYHSLFRQGVLPTGTSPEMRAATARRLYHVPNISRSGLSGMIKEGLKETGQSIREGVKEVGKGIKEKGREAGQEAWKQGRTIGEWFRDTGKKTGDALRKMGRDIKRFFTGD